jgi:tetratricopeptide (TPR) repeat protein
MITLLRLALLFEVANAAYLAAFDAATIFYHVQVVAHVATGLLLVIALVLRGRREFAGRWKAAGAANRAARASLVLIAASGTLSIGTALVLTVSGTSAPYRPLLLLHIGSSVLALVGVAAWSASRGHGARARRTWILLGLALAFPLGVRGYRLVVPPHVATIENPPLPPLSAHEEGGGEESPFFPSSAETVGNRLIPSDFFLESKACGNRNCHPDITAQWESSMHHFSSFNNQWYRKSIEYMQEVVGTTPSKWCGGCHDQAVLLTGKMDVPMREQIDTPEAQAGIGCLGCHSVVHVSDTMGQGGYVLEYPAMHRLVASDNRVLNLLHDYMVRLDPGPHKSTLLKPFHRSSPAEFCSACHKVHLDEPVNHYRWIRGFDEYGAWQGSGVSGQGARSFYYPEQPQDCSDCHMPLVPSEDQGNIDGFVHSHRFPAANTAVPSANRDEEQLEATRRFLTSGILTVDIFAAIEGGAPSRSEGDRSSEGSSARRDRERLAGSDAGPQITDPAPAAVAPLDRAAPFMRLGGSYRIDVVARTRSIGHFFPGGTVDAFDVWLELKVEDANGRVLYWSGYVEDGGQGPLEAAAHRYGSLMIDQHGNRINKRNAWAARALVYARLIPPGAADVGRFRLAIPDDARGPLTLTARMKHRKFSWWNTQFSYAGVRDPSVTEFAVSPHFDDGPFVFTGDTSDVSGAIKEVPVLPITVLAEDRVTLDLVGEGEGPVTPPSPQAFDRERWNDYGIGMLLQGDLASAKRAFERVMALDPGYADGFVNAGRVLVREGDHDAAVPLLERALSLDPQIASGHYFLALALKARGRYDEALTHLRAAADRFPRDRVVRNQIGRILFLQRLHREAIAEYETTLSVDPEDLTAHYNLMLCYRALGDEDRERLHETLYVRFKVDESAQEITGPYRRRNPEDNLERQPIHEHLNRYSGSPRAGDRRARTQRGASLR